MSFFNGIATKLSQLSFPTTAALYVGSAMLVLLGFRSELPWVQVIFLPLFFVTGSALLTFEHGQSLPFRHYMQTAIVVRLSLLALPIAFGNDVFRLIWDGWLQGHGINPYQYSPNKVALLRLQHLSFYSLIPQTGITSFDPIQQVMARFLVLTRSAVSDGNMIYVFKALALSADLGLAFAVHKSTGRDDLSKRVLVNPFWILLVSSQGLFYHHWVFFFVILWTSAHRFSPNLRAAILAMSALSHPFFLLFLLKRECRSPLKSSLVFVATFVLWWLPFLDQADIAGHLNQLYFLSGMLPQLFAQAQWHIFTVVICGLTLAGIQLARVVAHKSSLIAVIILSTFALLLQPAWVWMSLLFLIQRPEPMEIFTHK